MTVDADEDTFRHTDEDSDSEINSKKAMTLFLTWSRTQSSLLRWVTIMIV